MNQKVYWLEAMRGAASCWVLLHHASQSAGHFVGGPGVSQLVSNGFLGVDFFFVLSGFIIASSSHRLIESGRGIRHYFEARAIRIYIPYLPVGIAMVALYAFLPGLSASDRTPGLLTSLTLLPTASPPALSVAWTLVHELIFYSIFSVVFLSRRILWVVLTIWAAGIGWGSIAGIPLEGAWRYLLSPLNLCFLLGVITYHITQFPSRELFVVGAVVGLLALAIEASALEPSRVAISIGFSGLIVAACSPLAQRNSPGTIALLLGAASYSIYLVHNPVLSIAARGMAGVGLKSSPTVAFLLISCIALICGLMYFLWYERHALRFARRILVT